MIKKRILFIFILLLFFIIISVSSLGHLIEKRMSLYVTEEVNKVSKILIRKILNDEFLNNLDLEELFVINKSSDNEIELIDFDTVKVNNILGKINDEILYYFNRFDNGDISLINNYSQVFNNYINQSNRGLYINVPIGVVFTNSLVFSVGPSIPVKLLLSGQVESDIVTSIKQYGINNVLLEIKVLINAKEKIMFPFSSRNIDVSLEVPLIIELISGKVPENYLNTQKFDIMK